MSEKTSNGAAAIFSEGFLAIILFVVVFVILTAIPSCVSDPEAVKKEEAGKVFRLEVGQGEFHKHPEYTGERPAGFVIKNMGVIGDQESYLFEVTKFFSGIGTGEPYVLTVSPQAKSIWPTHYVRIDFVKLEVDGVEYVTHRPSE